LYFELWCLLDANAYAHDDRATPLAEKLPEK
jgi:hypothetical protein